METSKVTNSEEHKIRNFQLQSPSQRRSLLSKWLPWRWQTT